MRNIESGFHKMVLTKNVIMGIMMMMMVMMIAIDDDGYDDDNGCSPFYLRPFYLPSLLPTSGR